MHYTIPTYARFQWLNHPIVTEVLSQFLRPPKTGRKGYDKTLLFRWLIYRQLTKCSYRDLESFSGGIDYTTFIKFRQRLDAMQWFARAFRILTTAIIRDTKRLHLLLDSSFVETYSTHDEKGSEYSGYKEKNGFKLHQLIDFRTRLPLLQIVTGGARADIVWGGHLIRAAPASWNVAALVADKGYDSEQFVHFTHRKWRRAVIGIPLRRTSQEAQGASRQETPLNRSLKGAHRTFDRRLFNTRSEIERYFSRIKRVFGLGEERTRGLTNFRVNAYLVSIAVILEWMTKQDFFLAFFT